MGVEAISEAPALESFTPLEEHQERTPTTFFGGPPVLHFHSTGIRLLVPKDQLDENLELRDLVSSESTIESSTESSGTNGTTSDESLISDLDIWVTSQ
jgi:nucleotide-sensitive chloride channel 1A